MLLLFWSSCQVLQLFESYTVFKFSKDYVKQRKYKRWSRHDRVMTFCHVTVLFFFLDTVSFRFSRSSLFFQFHVSLLSFLFSSLPPAGQCRQFPCMCQGLWLALNKTSHRSWGCLRTRTWHCPCPCVSAFFLPAQTGDAQTAFGSSVRHSWTQHCPWEVSGGAGWQELALHQGGCSLIMPMAMSHCFSQGQRPFPAINDTQMSEQAIQRKRKLVLTFLLLSEFKLQRKKSH